MSFAPIRTHPGFTNSFTNCFGSSCANNAKGALNTPRLLDVLNTSTNPRSNQTRAAGVDLLQPQPRPRPRPPCPPQRAQPRAGDPRRGPEGAGGGHGGHDPLEEVPAGPGRVYAPRPGGALHKTGEAGVRGRAPAGRGRHARAGEPALADTNKTDN
eukprot:1176963-Prorocentrum_minimum.AAC.3